MENESKLSQKLSYYEEKEHLWQFWRLSNKSQIGPFSPGNKVGYFRHKIKQNLRYFHTIFCLEKNKQTFFPSLLPVYGVHLRLLIYLNSHPLAALRPERRPHLYWYSTTLLQTKLPAGRDTFPQRRKGDVRAFKCQKQADLTETEQSTVDSLYRYHCNSHVRFQSRSKLQGKVGIKSVTFHKFL